MFNSSTWLNKLRLLCITLLTSALIACGSGGSSSSGSAPVNGGGSPSVLKLPESFENGLGTWTATGLWHISTNRAAAGSHSVWYADPATGNYNTGSSTSGDLTSPTLTLSTSPVLAFDYFLDNECSAGIADGSADGIICGYDQLSVWISNDNGLTWERIGEKLTTSVSAFTAFDTATANIYLSAYSGQDVKIRFNFDSTNADNNAFEGAYIDNIDIIDDPSAPTAGNTAPILSGLFESFESGLGDWAATGLWHVTTNLASAGTRSVWYADPTTANYATSSSTSGSLISPPITLGATPSLSFDYFLDNECSAGIADGSVDGIVCDYDQLSILISSNNGVTWDQLGGDLGTSVSSFSSANTIGNIYLTIDMLAYSGQDVRIRFRFDSLDAQFNNYQGAYIDNVVVIDDPAITSGSLSLLDDDSTEASLPFIFTFNSLDYTSVFVNSNGNLSFGAGDISASENIATFLNGAPRIAPFWTDLNPGNGGSITYTSTPTSYNVAFTAIPGYLSSAINTFDVSLHTNGTVDINYGSMESTEAATIVGITQGGGAVDPGATDFSTPATHNIVGTTYETFQTLFDLSGVQLVFD